ncbi:MAG TPA: SPOR domain-containing protein [Blastocatellia bacterium]|nr:SPOR domain-containing protein [Blastocatellia bacterium]
MSNKQVVGIFVAGILVLLGIFWAGLTVSKDHGSERSSPQASQRRTENAKPAAPRPSPAATSVDPNTRYVVRVASFGTSQDANQLMQDLRTKYLSAYTQDPERGGKDTLYHVNIGPYDSREAADQVAQELAAEGRKGVTVLEQNQREQNQK